MEEGHTGIKFGDNGSTIEVAVPALLLKLLKVTIEHKVSMVFRGVWLITRLIILYHTAVYTLLLTSPFN